MTRPYAFTFWQPSGDTQPGYIDLCLDSQRRNLRERFEHVHLDFESVKDWVPEHELLWELAVPDGQDWSTSLAGRRLAIYCGMLRVALLRRHGGLWIDADTLVFPQFGLLAELVGEYDLLCGESSGAAGDNEVNNAILGARPGSPVVTAYWQAIQDRIAAKQATGQTGVRWGEYGFRMLRNTLAQTGGAGAWVAPWGVLDTIDTHLPHNDRRTFHRGATIEESVPPFALVLSIYNNAVEHALQARSAAELIADETLFSAAYRVAMGEVDCAHLAIHNAAQLRALNRADLTARRMTMLDRPTARLAAADQANARLRDRLGSCYERRDQLTARRDQLTARLDQLTTRRDQLASTLERRTVRLERTSERLNGARDQLAATRATNNRLRRRLRAQHAEIDQLNRRIADLERPFPRVRGLIRQARARVPASLRFRRTRSEESRIQP